MKNLVYTMFITNNHASFRLWWKEHIVKYQEVSKYYVHDCTVLFRNWLECLESFVKFDSSFFDKCGILPEMFNFRNLKFEKYFIFNFKRRELLSLIKSKSDINQIQ